jgi:protein-tyrosine phosphatase
MKSNNQINESIKSMIKTFDYLCVICGNNETKYCKDCYRNLCIKCADGMNFIVKKHHTCIECKDKICCYKKICYKCDIYPYHMITENIGVGSCASEYNNFDVILNANYPENIAKDSEITYQRINNKIIIHVGLLDTPNNDKLALDNIKEIIPVIYKLFKDKKILFHCFAGMSRSAMFAVAYLSYSLKITISEAHEMVKMKRKFIEINQGFMTALYNFEKEVVNKLN